MTPHPLSSLLSNRPEIAEIEPPVAAPPPSPGGPSVVIDPPASDADTAPSIVILATQDLALSDPNRPVRSDAVTFADNLTLAERREVLRTLEWFRVRDQRRAVAAVAEREVKQETQREEPQ